MTGIGGIAGIAVERRPAALTDTPVSDFDTPLRDETRPRSFGTVRGVISRRASLLIASSLVAVSACSGGSDGAGSAGGVPVPGVEAGIDGAAPDVSEPDGDTSDSTTTAGTASGESVTTDPDDPPSTTDSTTADTTDSTAATTTAPATTTTTTTEPPPDVFDPGCVVEVVAGDSILGIIDGFEDETISVASLSAENDLPDDTIYPGEYLDICIDNGLDDITGSERTEPNAAVVAEEQKVFIRAQQEKLNQLFAGYGMPELLVDGISGPVTRQRLCAARLGLGLEVTLTDMEPGSDEEKAMMAAPSIVAPYTSALNSQRWILVDRTCQIMFVGAGDTALDFVYPTSTGEDTFETRDQDRSRMFRYDPALDNDGWHESSIYPVEADNPLNGNMYRPLYFDQGQAIHGANNVPTTPQSKGCVRLRPENQDALVAWLGLTDADGPTSDADRINVTVNVQGEYPD